MIGRTLSHYKILAEISRGGMGVVYRALDLKLDREVAIKVLPPELVADPERKRRFIQEAKAAARLEHPHIGVVHEIDEVEGATFIVMELIRGEQLRDVLAKGPLSLRRSLEIAAEVAEGLAKAHEEGIVHRDVKPANIMATDDGHTKIIDFGLAKLVEPLAGEGSDIETLTRGETDPGKVMGTVSYMSPEQARGQKVDHSSDIFSFGIVLHEMVSGHPPFQGPTGADTLNAILSKPTPRLPSLGPDVSDEATFELQHILEKCLAKDPAERYQTIKDVVIDLRNVGRRLESGRREPAVTATRRKPWFYISAGAAAAAFLLVVAFLLFQPESEEITTSPGVKPSIAVLLFDNINEDPELDWLRLGLTEMLVTDLSQSTAVDVLSTDRLYQILEDMNRLDQRVTSFEVVKEIAERAGVATVILGNFMKSGDTIRIQIRVQEAAGGKILTTEKVEGSDARVFPMADDLAQRVRKIFETSIADGRYKSLEELTTSSPEAFRFFVEGRHLHNREFKEEEAIALVKRAVEIDPDFAEAHRFLATLFWNIQNYKEAELHAEQALAHADRLIPYELFNLQGRYYSLREEDYGRAIEAYRNAYAIDPTYHNYPNRLKHLERYEEANQIFEKIYALRPQDRLLLDGNYSEALISEGRYERAYEVVQDMLNTDPDNPFGYRMLANLYLFTGELDGALDAFKKEESLSPGLSYVCNGRWWVYTLRDQWEEASLEAQALEKSVDITWKWQALINHAFLQLLQGRPQDALQFFERAVDLFDVPGRVGAVSDCIAGRVLLEIERPDAALKLARRAQKDGRGNFPEWRGIFVEALALAKVGRMDEAEAAAERLKQRTEPIPTDKEKRRYHHLQGELALARKETSRATEELEKAQTMLPLRGRHGWILGASTRYDLPEHVPIWYSLASAYLSAGDEEKAAEWYRRIIEAGVERVEWPILYVRSFYFLGKIHESSGDIDKAHEYYRRFHEYWKDGDMDRERVEEVKNKLGTT